MNPLLPPPLNHSLPGSRRYGRYALVGFAGFIVLTALLHILRPDFDPARHQLSEYAIGPYGNLFSIALMSLGAGSLALWAGLSAALRPTRTSRIGVGLLLVWSMGALVAGVFPTDPGGIPVSVNGIIHGLAASIAFFSAVIGAVVLAIHLRTDPHWAAVRWLMLVLAVLAMFLLGFLGLPDALRGAGERVFVTAVVAWLCIVAWHLDRA
jgi:MFS family permease